MKSDKKRLLENFISLGALQIFSYVIPLISLPYLSRVLGADKFGLVFFAQAFIQYFMVLTDYGFNLSATREIAVNRHNQNNISNIFNSVMMVKIILVIISYAILLVCTIFVPKIHQYSLIFNLTFLMVIGNAIYPVWFFQGIEHMKYITFLNIFYKTLFLVLIFIFVKQSGDYILVPILNSLGFLVSGIVGFVFAVRKFNIKLYFPSFNSIKKQFIYSSEFFLSRAACSIYTNTNAFFIGLLTSNVMVAYFVAAEKIYTAVKHLALPIERALYPFIAKNKDIKTYKKIFKMSLIANIFITLFVFVFAKQIILIFYSTELLEAYKILRIFCVSILITWNTIALSYPLLGGFGYTKEANRPIIIASIIHIVGLVSLYKFSLLNVYSISYLIWLTEGYVLLAVIYYIHKYKILVPKEGK